MLCLLLLSTLIDKSDSACCLLLNITINLPGKKVSAYNAFSGPYEATDEYTDNGTYPIYQNKLKPVLSLAHAPGPIRYTTPWAFYNNQKQPPGDNNSLLFLGVSLFGCPESFAVGGLSLTVKPSLRYYHISKNEYIDVPQPDASKYLSIECKTKCLSSKLPPVPPDAIKGYTGSSPPRKWLMPHGRGRYPCKNGRGHYEFRCLGNTEFTSLGRGCTAEPPRGLGQTYDGKGGATGCCKEVSVFGNQETALFPNLAKFVGVWRQDGTSTTDPIASVAGFVYPVYRKEDDANLFLAHTDVPYDLAWNFWGGPFYGPGTQIGDMKLTTSRCPERFNEIFLKNYTTGYFDQDLSEQISIKCGYHLF